jgi:DNA-directed RNA polymerase subunit RPC12/RpoP
MIQFACPSCKATCSVDDKFKGRKIRCPKCGARVVHVQGAEVRLLTAGTVHTAVTQPLPAPAPSPGDAPPSELTPVATAVVPHIVGEFVRQDESKQNVWIIGGLIGVFAASLSILGIVINVPLLAVTPVGVALSILAVWLWLRKKKLEQKARGMAKTEVTPKV